MTVAGRGRAFKEQAGAYSLRGEVPGRPAAGRPEGWEGNAGKVMVWTCKGYGSRTGRVTISTGGVARGNPDGRPEFRAVVVLVPPG
jgi:hypothetical protein